MIAQEILVLVREAGDPMQSCAQIGCIGGAPSGEFTKPLELKRIWWKMVDVNKRTFL